MPIYHYSSSSEEKEFNRCLIGDEIIEYTHFSSFKDEDYMNIPNIIYLGEGTIYSIRGGMYSSDYGHFWYKPEDGSKPKKEKLKLCINCANVVVEDPACFCKKNSKINLVNGRPIFKLAFDERSPSGSCGVEGRN